MSVKRYNPELERDGGLGLPSLTMRSNFIGSWVEHRDYAALEAKCAALAAENAGLKALARGWANATDDCLFEEHGEIFHDSIDACEEELKTICPTTDAFLAEVRARVWIEGNEPAEFGRYWVRYETDVGPRYCSAQWMEYNFCAGSDTNIHRIWLADHSRSINSLRGVTHYTQLPTALESSQLRKGGA